MQQNKDKQKYKTDQFSFTYNNSFNNNNNQQQQYPSYWKNQQTNKPTPIQPLPLPTSNQVQQKTTPTITNRQKKQQQQKSPQRQQFFKKILKYQEQLPKQQMQQYKAKVRGYKGIQNNLGLIFYGYLAYNFTFSHKMWFKLTTGQSRLIGQIFGLLLLPSLVFGKLIEKQNYQFYNRNRIVLDKILTEQDKKKIGLADLIASYQ